MICMVCRKLFEAEDGEICVNCATLVCSDCCEPESGIVTMFLCSRCREEMVKCAICELHYRKEEAVQCPICGESICSDCHEFRHNECGSVS